MRRLLSAFLLYAALAGAALGWAALSGRPLPYFHPTPWLLEAGVVQGSALSIGLALTAGSAVAWATIWASRWFVRRAAWAKALHREMRSRFGRPTGGEILALALASGVAEELFFRGVMQVELGLVISSLIFGAVHVAPSAQMLSWTLWATIMGFVFGALYALTGELVAPVLAHVWINYENLHYITHVDIDGPGSGRDVSDPRINQGLVGSTMRAGGKVER